MSAFAGHAFGRRTVRIIALCICGANELGLQSEQNTRLFEFSPAHLHGGKTRAHLQIGVQISSAILHEPYDRQAAARALGNAGRIAMPVAKDHNRCRTDNDCA